MDSFPIPRIVVSRCIETEACRWNGLIIKDAFIRSLMPYVQCITPCPEVEIGLGIPRPPIRIIRPESADPGKERLYQPETGMDVTDRMEACSSEILDNLPPVDGFILKGRSPSCGIKDVKIYPGTSKGPALPDKRAGFFATRVLERFPGHPVEEEGRLTNLSIREHFLTFLYTRTRFRELLVDPSMAVLVDFHARHKYLFMMYRQSVLKKMGQLVANHDRLSLDRILEAYSQHLGELFGRIPNRGQVVNVLHHIMGYFSKRLSPEEKSLFLENTRLYTDGRLPPSVPIAILYSWVVRFGEPYLAQQYFFRPFPVALASLRDSGK